MRWPLSRSHRSFPTTTGPVRHTTGPTPDLVINTIWRLTPDEVFEIEMRNADMGDIIDDHRPGRHQDVRIPVREDAGLPPDVWRTVAVTVPFSIALWVGGGFAVHWLFGHPPAALVTGLVALGIVGVMLGRRQ